MLGSYSYLFGTIPCFWNHVFWGIVHFFQGSDFHSLGSWFCVLGSKCLFHGLDFCVGVMLLFFLTFHGSDFRAGELYYNLFVARAFVLGSCSFLEL